MSKLIELNGKLHLLKTKDGGRKDYILSGYRPAFEVGGKLFSGMIILKKQEKAFPGETKDATVYFVPGMFKDVFLAGMDLIFKEGSRTYGDFLITKANGIVDWDPQTLNTNEADSHLNEMIKIMTSQNSVDNGKVSQLIDEAIVSEYSNNKEVEELLHF